jgi:aspartate-semialdehyde dehydrogenase
LPASVSSSPVWVPLPESHFSRGRHRSLGRVRRHADEGSGLHYLSQHAQAISGGAALLSVAFLRLLLKTFKLTLILGGMGTLAYFAILHR